MTRPGTPHRTAALLISQVRYQNALFLRTPAAAFFTLALPLVFLVVLNELFAPEALFALGVPAGTSAAAFFAPSLAVFSAATATYTNLAIGITARRDEGLLKRVRGTPLPPGLYLVGAIGSATWLAILGTAIVLAFAGAVYGVRMPWLAVPAASLSLVVGVASFAALGLAVAALAPSSGAAPAMANITLLPLSLVSGIFLPMAAAPDWLRAASGILPLRRFVDSFRAPFVGATGLRVVDLLIVLAWGATGLLIAMRYFRWEPQATGRQRAT